MIGGQLHRIYGSLLESEIGEVRKQPEIARSLLESFVLPERFRPIRLEA